MARQLSLQRLIAILSVVPADMQVRSWEGGRLDPDLNRIIFSPYNGVTKSAAKVLGELKYLPCKLTRPGKDITEFGVYVQPDDISGPMKAWKAEDIVSADGELVVREFDEGKYTAVYVGGRAFHALRYDAPWRDLVGDNFVTAVFLEAVRDRVPE